MTSSIPISGGLRQVDDLGQGQPAGPDAIASKMNVQSKPADTARPKARKRTKTGCLTCRKRRIKCGEERPTCNNCVKSKRNCEGYTPRVIFKDPMSGFPPGPPGAAVPFHSLGDQDTTSMLRPQLQTSSANPMPLPTIAPRPLPQEDSPALNLIHGMAGHGIPGDPYDTSGHQWNGQQYPQHVSTYLHNQQYSAHQGPWDGNPGIVDAQQPPRYFPLSIARPGFRQPGTGGSDSGVDMTFTDPASESGQGSDWAQSSTCSQIPAQAYVGHGRYGPTPAASGGSASSIPKSVPLQQESPQSWAGSILHGTEGERPPLALPRAMRRNPELADAPTSREGASSLGENGRGLVATQGMDPGHLPLPMHTSLTLDDRDDDYWDVDSEDEIMGPYGHMAGAGPSELGLMLAISANRNGQGIRSLYNFLNEPNALSTYYPAYTASPLLDPQTARIFCHFVTATGPTLSIWERHPANPSILFTGYAVPMSQRSLWTYTLPMRALAHQGLLHAMLAIASLHIAKLQQSSPTPSLKHYHYALRRIAKALGQPAKRRDVSTLAATLLLGFYEVTTAEHNKWDSHLAGAKQLIMDIDFAGIGKRMAAHKAADGKNAAYDEFNTVYEYPYRGREFATDPPRNCRSEINEDLVSTIMGWQVRYNEYGFVEDGDRSWTGQKPLTSKEMEEFDIQRDLFWWYCKQDLYRTMVSGNRLLLPYDRWSHCPPRAPVGKLDAVFGTSDYLILLTARIADFAAKDQRRKVQAMEAARNRSKSAHGFSPALPNHSPYFASPSWSTPSSANAGAYPAHAPSFPAQGQIPMYGMMPSTGPLRLPRGFDPEPDEESHGNPLAQGLEAATLEAENEWNSMCAALDAFEEALGPDYQPLSPDHMQPLSTPFGPALYYRSYPISCIWVLFYTARIIAMRAQPSMPPAAMIAAAVAAPRTAGWANMIGRICAGMQPLSNAMPLNPSHGAALRDSCMGLFHAGVQYRDAAQRGWTVTKLRDISRMTGWQTAALIASGCERSWIKAAEMGKGPPYQRTMNLAAKDDRVAGRYRDPTAARYPPKDNSDRRFIRVNPVARVHWAMGILSAEEDMKSLSLKD